MQQATAWRISAIEKFVPLSDEQRRRLAEKFVEERKAKAEGRESVAESLEEILGEENAQVYRGQVKATYERVQNEELEKDTVWMARKLALSPEQEGRMRATFEDVERAVAAEYPASQLGAGDTPQQRVQRMIAENKRRVQLRAERLRQVLPPEQYEAYMKAESESAASEMEVFHDSGEEKLTSAN
jgi:regulator of replication initiation timing